uniref:DUF4328 domain-containing protein n=1 Tax=uncultured Erythrobacter sp. TaxID=263913 RepID=UPI00262750C9|nr:DUF4328 domain-containing protein [uncultured Erythrobacter sp.]
MQAANLRIPALILTILSWAVIAFSLIYSLSLAVWLGSYTQFVESPLMLAVSGLAAVANLIAYPLSVIAVLVWIFLAHGNLHRAGVDSLNYTPAWAALSFFVPVANLFVPFKAMRELANRSAGEPMELAEADVDEVFSWWGCWIGSMIVGMIVLYTMLVTIVPWLWMTTPFWATQVILILASALTAGSAFFLIKTVKRITDDQMNGSVALSTFE